MEGLHIAVGKGSAIAAEHIGIVLFQQVEEVQSRLYSGIFAVGIAHKAAHIAVEVAGIDSLVAVHPVVGAAADVPVIQRADLVAFHSLGLVLDVLSHVRSLKKFLSFRFLKFSFP